MRSSLLLVLISIFWVSCTNGTSNETKEISNFQVKITDSLQIDYLGSLWMLDYDSSSQQYLAYGNRDKELVVLNQEGEIISNFDFASDGPEALGWIDALSLENGKIGLIDRKSGFLKFDIQGNRLWNYKLPYSFYHINSISGRSFYSFGSELFYLRPERSDNTYSGNSASMFQEMYRLPILEAIDTLTQEVRMTMDFPATSIYRDGEYHFWMFPNLMKSGKDWILSFRQELQFYVYRERNKEIELFKTVSLGLSDFVEGQGVSFEQADDYFEMTKNLIPGSIQSIYRHEGNTLVVYHKGVAEEIVKRYDRDDRDASAKLNLEKKFFLAVFNSAFQLLQNEVPLPEGLIFTSLISSEGEILALKDQVYFGSEQDQVIYYKLKLVEG
ncbi:MAG: hypothetical protein PSV36_06115 [Algoriphagus sp.]|nr:hypothetical protein [Algoriphagus sp.]